MALTKTPIELSSTPGIVDNSNATAITIDSSENVALAGAISIVGGIGELSAPSANDLAIYGTASGHTGIRFHDVGILPTNNAGAITDNDCDIGIGTHRFKDLFLSGKANTGSITTDNANTQFNKISRTGAVALYVQQGDNTNDILQLRSGNGQAGTGTQRVTVTASGVVMVATTNTNPHTFTTGSGLSINSAGMLNAAKQAAVVQILNRTGNSDGVIQEYKKDGTTVGSIGSHVNGLLIGTTEGSDAFLKFESNAVRPSAWNGSYRDASIDLGHTSSRFKDLYLSGGVYLGGTGAANKLDDYEEGTWTPFLDASSTDPSLTYNAQLGAYEKIGAFVHASFFINV